jgi:hypothetical protein
MIGEHGDSDRSTAENCAVLLTEYADERLLRPSVADLLGSRTHPHPPGDLHVHHNPYAAGCPNVVVEDRDNWRMICERQHARHWCQRVAIYVHGPYS